MSRAYPPLAPLNLVIGIGYNPFPDWAPFPVLAAAVHIFSPENVSSFSCITEQATAEQPSSKHCAWQQLHVRDVLCLTATVEKAASPSPPGQYPIHNKPADVLLQ
ncbi:unnamed protein product [Pleuronectes platessa]|uniref:Uncharacterized protein n=1 Tax=Pleuronectes platessa TaxID=8262 RepID=A0A9N7YEJ9_PLEPL|nr:unnamed protein product [Pleuronectes platessa]